MKTNGKLHLLIILHILWLILPWFEHQGNKYYFIILAIMTLLMIMYADIYSFDYAKVMLVSNYITNQIS